MSGSDANGEADRVGRATGPGQARTERWRRLALYLLLFGMIGITAELALLGHTEDRLQWTPIALLAGGIVASVIVLARPTRRVVRVFGALMAAYLPAGAIGLYLHIESNVEFELEMRPSMAGTELVRESLTGAIPALAPGTMVQLGLLGLLVCFRHPALMRRDGDADPETNRGGEE